MIHVKKPLKVLMLSHSSEIGGGAERSMLDLFDHWAKQGLIEPEFIIRHPVKNMAPELKKRGWKYHPVYYTNWSQRNLSRRAEDVFRNARENTKAVQKIQEIIRKVKPDVVMTNTIVSPWAAIAAYFERVPHVWFVREYGDADHRHIFEIGREKMFEDIGTMSDLVVTNSQTLGRYVAEYIQNTSITTVYTPFDLNALEEKASQSAPNPFVDDSSLKLVITGRIAPSKGQHEAAKAVGELNRRGVNAELCVIGDAAEAGDDERLKETIAHYGIEKKVHLVGHQPNPLAIVKYADIGIMPSHREAFGRVTFEYMSVGLPIVGADSGATPELVEDGKNGYIYTLSSATSLASKLMKYAKDPTLIEKHGNYARKKTVAMMEGKYNADHLFQTMYDMLSDPSQLKNKHPLNYAEHWLNYPLIAQQYIDESRVIAMSRLLYGRSRSAAKSLYLAGPTMAKRAVLPITPKIPKKFRPAKMEAAYQKLQKEKQAKADHLKKLGINPHGKK